MRDIHRLRRNVQTAALLLSVTYLLSTDGSSVARSHFRMPELISHERSSCPPLESVNRAKEMDLVLHVSINMKIV